MPSQSPNPPTPSPSTPPSSTATDPAMAQAQRPVGSNLAPDEVLFEGITRHTASLGGYTKWTFFCIAGVGLGLLLQQVESLALYPMWLLGLLGLPGLLGVFLRHITTRYKISLRRVEYEKGILTKRVDSLELWRVLDVRYSQTLLDRLTGNGRITLVSTDRTDSELVLFGLPRHRKLFEQLRDAVQAARHTSRPMELVGPDGMVESVSPALMSAEP